MADTKYFSDLTPLPAFDDNKVVAVEGDPKGSGGWKAIASTDDTFNSATTAKLATALTIRDFTLNTDVNEKIFYYLNSPATQTLATSGAGDLAAKIATLVDDDILEIQTSASYSSITIPSGKRFAIRVQDGFNVEINTAQGITLANGGSDVFISGLIFDGNPSGTHSQGSAICFAHEAQVQDITFHNCTFTNNDHSAVLLSYHQSTGGDNYATANLLSEFSDRIAFANCHFFGAADDSVEGGALTARGINQLLITGCTYNGQRLSRQIHLQNCIGSMIISTEVQEAQGSGNGEGIKIDKIGSPTYRNSAFIIGAKVKNCIEGIDVDDSADVLAIDCIVSECEDEGYCVDDTGKGVFINCIAYNCKNDGFRQEVGGIIELKSCNSFNNQNANYQMDGGYTPDSSNISDPDQTFFNWVNFPIIQKEPTGFTEPENIIVNYDSSTRKITLTGTVNGYYRGKKIPALTTGWLSNGHPAGNDKYYLVYGGQGFKWVSAGSQNFYDLLIAYVNYGVTDKWGMRECHGLMPWQTHLELHFTIGTYKQDGGTLADYVLSSTTAADRQPSVSATVIKDEDLPTTNPALVASGNYTQFTLSSTDTANFNKTATEIVPLSGNQPYWNEFTGGAWQQTLMSNNYYMSIWLVAIPNTADSASQDYRYLWVQGQNESLTELEQIGLNPNDVNLGELTNLTPELVFISQVIIRYQAANWFLTDVRSIDGTRYSQSTSPQGNYLSVVTSDTSLTGLGTVASPLSVAGGTEDLWDRVTGATNFLNPNTIGDVVSGGPGGSDFLRLKGNNTLTENFDINSDGTVSMNDGTQETFLAMGGVFLQATGSASGLKTMISLANLATAASMDNTRQYIRFRQKAFGGVVNYEEARIVVGTVGTVWNDTAATRDSYMEFQVVEDGVLGAGLKIDPNKDVTFYNDVYIPGKLTVAGPIDLTILLLDAQATAPSTTDGGVYYDSVETEFEFLENGIKGSLARVPKKFATINWGETAAGGVTGNYAGVEIDRGEQDPHVLMFDETTTTFNIGSFYLELKHSQPSPSFFQVGQRIVGQTSGALGYVYKMTLVSPNAWTFLKAVVGTFQNGETIANGLGDTAVISLITVHNNTYPIATSATDNWKRTQARTSPAVYVIEPDVATDGIALNGFMANPPDIPSAVTYWMGLFDSGSSVPDHRNWLYSPNSTYPKYAWYLSIDNGSTSIRALELSSTGLTIGTKTFDGGLLDLAKNGTAQANTDYITITNTLSGQPDITGTESSIYFAQERLDGTPVNMGRISFGAENNWINDSNQDGAFKLSLVQDSVLVDRLDLSSDGVFQLTGKTFKVTGAGLAAGFAGEFVGLNSNGSTNGVLKLTSGSQVMILDGNEIDGNQGIDLNANLTTDITMVLGGGDVGVNIASPGAKFHTQDAAALNSPTILATNTARRGILGIEGSSTGDASAISSGLTFIDTDNAARAYILWNSAAATTQLETWIGGSPRFLIDENGHAGIGVATAPNAMLHVDQASTTAAIPTLILDQADISEGFIDLLGSDRGAVPTSTVNSVASARIELNGTVYVIALHADQ